jgi:tetratricopeptide (TPR) repeat protein
LDIYEKLAKTKPERFEPNWVTSLGNYANRLSDVGRAKDAEITAKQALDIHEKLAKAKPERFEPDWADSLNNYAYFLSNLGGTEDAEITAKQALDIYEKLAKTKPERFEPDWANSLNNYAYLLNELGHVEAAEIAAKQALAICERLAKAKPKQFEFKWLCSKMLVMRCSILTGNQPLEIERITTLHTSSRKKLELSFQEHFLRSFTTHESALVKNAITEAEANWSKMDATQKRACETERLLLAGLADSKQIVCNLTYNWQQDLQRFRAQRNGRLPCWMLEMANLAGFTL